MKRSFHLKWAYPHSPSSSPNAVSLSLGMEQAVEIRFINRTTFVNGKKDDSKCFSDLENFFAVRVAWLAEPRWPD